MITKNVENIIAENITELVEYHAHIVATLADTLYNKYKRFIVLVPLIKDTDTTSITVCNLIRSYLRLQYTLLIPVTKPIDTSKSFDDSIMCDILSVYNSKDIIFVDTTTSTGNVMLYLEAACSNYEELSPRLAVLSDPANITDLKGTDTDFINLLPLESEIKNIPIKEGITNKLKPVKDIHTSKVNASGIIELAKYNKLDNITAGFTDTIKALNNGLLSEVILKINAKKSIDYKIFIEMLKYTNITVNYKLLKNYNCIGILNTEE
jgi:hypothetical protein